MNILLVDDDLFVLNALQRRLHGHAVTIAPGGNSAMAILKGGHKFDVILCDVHMPAMRGEVFYDAVHEAMPEQATRIVFMTGGACADEERDFLNTHPSLLKPFDSEQLEGALAPFLRLHEAPAFGGAKTPTMR